VSNAELPVEELPVEELPNGLPMFNLFLHLPALAAQLQLFRLVRSYVIDRFTLHTLLVHPQELDRLAPLSGTLGFCQLHGEVWALRQAADAVTLGRLGAGAEYAIRAHGPTIGLFTATGHQLTSVPAAEFARDDLSRVRLLRECFLAEYADQALSVPLVRGYPGLTSLIRHRRAFPQLFASDPVGPSTVVVEPWRAVLAGVPR
jgi:hypothetical protein